MGQYLNIGNAGFKTIRNGLYVDKTGMIDYINKTLGTPQKLTCVSRPRRFGKSFAAKMLCAYYDKSCDSKMLFEGLEISQSPDFSKYLNRYPVIYLDITWFISVAGTKNNIRSIVKNIQDGVINELSTAYPNVQRRETLPEMLLAVSEVVGEKFIIIIDEWDALFREAKDDKNLQEEYIQLLRGLFKSSGQTDRMIEAAYMTGILPIKKYGTQSAMTDFQEYSMLRPGPLKKYVGFTEEETEQLFAGSRLDFAEARKWYDGYRFGEDTHIYNPKSVMDALQFEEFGSYWTQSETYEALRMYVDMDLDGLKEAIMDMLAEKPCRINSRTFQNDMTTIRSKDDVLTLLVHLGYLAYDSFGKVVSIPNEEIHEEFLNAVENGSRKELMRLIGQSDRLLADTIAMNETAVAAAIQEAHNIGTAPTFYNNEQSLRSVIRFAYISCVDSYQLIEELPSGTGYADIVFLPKKRTTYPAMVIELKGDKTVEGAIEQIKSRNYPQILEGITGDMLLVGINYSKKTKEHSCKIEKYQI